ncbi:hypothetical protein RCM86_09805, partial [Escherichia coli]|nr:hypothetical protein [Escherichia coli]
LKKSLQKAVRQKEGVETARNELDECLRNEPVKPVRGASDGNGSHAGSPSERAGAILQLGYHL